jgi:hypothetical protein
VFASALTSESLPVLAKVFPEIEWLMRQLIWRLGQPQVRPAVAEALGNDPMEPPH